MGWKVPKQKISGLSPRNLIVLLLLANFCSISWNFRWDLNQSLVWQVCLSFYETRNKHMAWFSKVERLYWEQWCIQLHVVPPAPLKSKNFYDSSQSVETGGGTLSFIFLEFLSRFCLLECVQACCMIHGPPSLGFEWNHFHSLHCFLHFCFAPKLVNCFFVLPQTETMMDERQRRHATLEASLREVIDLVVR